MKKLLFTIKNNALSRYYIIAILLLSPELLNAQCTVTSSVNASTLTQNGTVVPFTNCNGLITLGDGQNATVVRMDYTLNLTSLGPVLITSRNKSGFDFSPGNETLRLAAGSVLKFEDGAVLIGGSCNASERIIIGDRKLASCNGQAGFDFSFADLLNNGGFGVVNLSSGSPVCLTNSVDLIAQPFPPDTGTIIRWFDAPNGNLLLEGTTLTADLDSPTTTFYAEATFPDGTISPIETIEKPVKKKAIWDGSTWQNTFPDENVDVLFQAALTTSGNLNACNLEVNTGNVVVNPGHTLRVINQVIVTAGASLTFENDASLVQVNNVANSGNILYKRNTTPMERFDFTYWSSPVSNQTLFNLSPETLSDKYFYWDSPTQRWLTIMGGQAVMQPGVGYIVRSPQSYTIGNMQVYNGQFNGVPNNGSYQVSVTAPQSGSFALVGNPYPSAVSADAFILQNSSVLSGSLYFWTHNTPITNLQFTSDDYSVYNLTGGTRTALTGGTAPDGFIASGQGFFVDLATSGTLVFNNSQRALGSNNRFFEANKPDFGEVRLNTANTFTTTVTQEINQTHSKSRLWLNLTGGNGYFHQLLLAYVDQASDEKDKLWDANYLDAGTNPVGVFSNLKDERLTINAQNTENKTDFSIGYKSTVNNLLSLSIDNTDGIFKGAEAVWLIDNENGTRHNLKESPYQFLTGKGTFDNRFKLSLHSPSENTSLESLFPVKITRESPGLRILVEGAEIQSVKLYTFTGTLLFSRDRVNHYETVIPVNPRNNNPIVMLEVTLKNGFSKTMKVAL